MKFFTLTKLGRVMLLSAVAVVLTVGTSAVFAQQPTLDKLSFIQQGSGQNIYFHVKAASNVISGAIVIPETYKNFPVTEVPMQGFRDCSNMTSITIPAKVRKIDAGAFMGCTNLKSVTFGGSSTSVVSSPWEAFPASASLKVKYGEGGAGTYTRETGGNTWTKQGGYAPPPPSPQHSDGGGRRHGTTLNGIWTRNDGTQITISENGQTITVTDGSGRFTRIFTER